jgi:CHAT domain-containing protein
VLNTKGIENRIKAFHNAIQTKNTDEFKSQGREVYRQLLAPFKDELKAKELIIIPHGPLWNLNFDLLLTADTNSNNPAEFPYLLKEYAISYGNSAQMLFNISDNSSITRAQCLAFSYTDEQEMAVADRGSLDQLRSTRGDLPGSREEIKAIATYVSGLYFFGEEATKWRFKENSGEFGILHLALHGELNEEDPEQSRLIFSDLNEEEEDNFLYSHEISTMRLPAELGVLSACDTGAGEIITGEGIMSLGNAFQYAGTRSLLLSRWPASDETTAAIMNYFYKNMSKGMSKALALQKAKKEYLTSVTGQKSHPFYWGGFYVLGSNAPIELKGRTAWFFPAVGLSLALLGFILIGKARRRRVAA